MIDRKENISSLNTVSFFGSGYFHLIWIGRFQFFLLPLGSIAWLFRSPSASLVFTTGGSCSIAFWFLHRFIVGKMLTTSVKLRWFFGLLGLLKLALIVVVLHGMMKLLPQERVALSTGILLFVAAIFLEAFRLMIWPNQDQFKKVK